MSISPKSGALLYVRSVSESVKFYTQLELGKLVDKPSEDFAILESGTMMLYLHQDPKEFGANLRSLSTDEVRGKGVIIQIPVEDVRIWTKYCESLGREISLGPVEQHFGHIETYLYDPDGYNIVVFSIRE